MATFPTIYRHGTLVQKPVVSALTDTMAQDPTIRGVSDGGYVTTRARFTRITRKWTLRYEWLSAANKDTLKAFEDAHYAGSGSFTWVHPDTGASYTVRFLGVATYTPHADTNFLWWAMDAVVEQV